MAAQAALTRAEGELKLAQDQLARVEPLLARQFVPEDYVEQARTSGSSPPSVEQARTALAGAAAAVEAARAQRHAAVAAVEQARPNAARRIRWGRRGHQRTVRTPRWRWKKLRSTCPIAV